MKKVRSAHGALLLIVCLVGSGPFSLAHASDDLPVIKPEDPARFTADLSIDLQGSTYFFHEKHHAFAVELSPRFGFLVANFIDLGLNFIAGYNAGSKSWSQATMFGLGPYVGFRVPVTEWLRLTPWVAVNYHQTFLDGFTPGPPTSTDPNANLIAARQIVRVDVHCDAVFHPQARTAFAVGAFVKTRAASFDSGLGESPELDAGVRVGAISYF